MSEMGLVPIHGGGGGDGGSDGGDGGGGDSIQGPTTNSTF